MKLKDMKEKHDHKFTDLLKVGIFALLMIAPLFASVSQMLYATFNKNAHESYSGTNTTETYYYSYDELKPRQEYIIYINNTDTYTGNIIIYGDYIYYVNTNNQQIDISSYNRVYFYNTNKIGFYGDDQTTIYSDVTVVKEIHFVFSYYNSNDFVGLEDQFTQTFNNNYSNLDNAFYYGVDQMTKSDLFNWTQNTAIYTGVKAMTDNLQIQTPAIAILIVYWFILTIIYIIIDIVIKCFTAITHLI